MVFVRIDAELELLACIFEGSNHVDSILEMDIVVASAVDEKVVAFTRTEHEEDAEITAVEDNGEEDVADPENEDLGESNEPDDDE